MTRSFVAIPIAGREAAILARAGRALKAGRAVPEESIHLTLAFLGAVGDAALQEVHAELSMLKAAPADIAFGGPGTPGGAHPAVIWCEVVPSASLLALQGDVVRALRRAGLELEARRFRPHVTIARMPRHAPARPDIEAAAALLARLEPVRAVGFSLMASELRPDGARYEELASYPLVHG